MESHFLEERWIHFVFLRCVLQPSLELQIVFARKTMILGWTSCWTKICEFFGSFEGKDTFGLQKPLSNKKCTPPSKPNCWKPEKSTIFKRKKNSSSLTSRRLGFRFPAVHVFSSGKKSHKKPDVFRSPSWTTDGNPRSRAFFGGLKNAFFLEGEVEQPLHHQVDLEGFPYLDNFLMVGFSCTMHPHGHVQ